MHASPTLYIYEISLVVTWRVRAAAASCRHCSSGSFAARCSVHALQGRQCDNMMIS